ncbi:MAG TPA: hypothetical protein VF386_13680, partial [Usitatibacter sp.]
MIALLALVQQVAEPIRAFEPEDTFFTRALVPRTCLLYRVVERQLAVRSNDRPAGPLTRSMLLLRTENHNHLAAF